MVQWDKIKVEELSEEQQGIIGVIGLENYRKMVEHFGGQSVYIAKADTLLRSLRDREIIEAFTGSNYTELARKYNLTERAVRNIVDGSPASSGYCKRNQISLFEEQE